MPNPTIEWVDDPVALHVRALEWGRSVGPNRDLRLMMATWEARFQRGNGNLVIRREPWPTPETLRDAFAIRDLGGRVHGEARLQASQRMAQSIVAAWVSDTEAVVGEKVPGRARYNANRRIGTALWSEMNSLAAVSSLNSWHIRRLPRRLEEVNALYTSGMILLPGLALICRPPTQALRPIRVEDGRGIARFQLHREDGPVIQFPSGWGMHVIRDRIVPSWVIDHPETMTVTQIRRERNTEIRRIMIERFGLDRFLTESKAIKVAEDADAQGHRRVLWDTTLASPRSWNPERIRVVQVINSTPEPDGTRKSYFLRVPPTVRTPLEGVAWTFGQRPETYRRQLTAES